LPHLSRRYSGNGKQGCFAANYAALRHQLQCSRLGVFVKENLNGVLPVNWSAVSSTGPETANENIEHNLRQWAFLISKQATTQFAVHLLTFCDGFMVFR